MKNIRRHVFHLGVAVVFLAFGCGGKDKTNDDDKTLRIEFVSPTEEDGAGIEQDWTEVALSIRSSLRASAFIVFDDSLAGYWAFDEGAGLEAGDGSGNGNEAAIENGAQWTEGRFGGALSFDGVDDRVVAADDDSLPSSGPFTVEVWINPGSSQESCDGDDGNRGVVAKCDQEAESSNRCSWQLRYGSDDDCRLGFMFKVGSDDFRWVSVGQELTPGQWYHVAVTYDGTMAHCYLDGEERDSTEVPSVLPSDSRLFIGAGGYGTYFHGLIDEVRIQKRALSAEEIAASFEASESLSRRFEGLAEGEHRYQAFVVDAEGNMASTEERVLTVSVSGAFSITTTSLPDGLVGEVYRQSLTASGGREPYVWSIESGSLPDGLSLSSEGEISGTPERAGDFDFTVQVTDADARTATKELSIHVGEESPYIPTYYVDATNGDDSNDGRSPEQAWQSLAKVSETSFEPGDVIAFKRGEVWQGRLTISSSGTEDAPIVFTAYGSGEKPVIRDIFQQDLSWSSYSTNIWRAPVSHRIQRLWEGETELHRAYILDPFEDLGESFRFGWQDGYLYLYKTSEPSPSDYSFYKMGSAIYLSGQRYVVIDNLDAQGGETCLLADSCQYVTVTNCNIGKDAFVGIDVGGDSEGSAAHNKILHNTIDSNWTFDDTDAYVGRNSDSRGCEDGIHITHYGYDIEIADNTFKDWGHSHIYLYDSRSDGIYDISIHHNHFSTENADYGKGFDVLGNVHDVELAYNHFYKVTGGSDFNGHDNHFHHNLMEETKHYGIRGGSGRNGNALNTNNGAGDVFNNVIESNIFCYSDSEGITVNAYSTHGYVSHDITIRHNILYKNGENSISGVDSPSLSIWNTEYLSNVTVESNIIVHAGSSNMIRYNGTTFSSIAAFEDAQVDGDVLRDNSDSDPLFVSETDYTLQSGSPAADFDIDVSQIGPRY